MGNTFHFAAALVLVIALIEVNAQDIMLSWPSKTSFEDSQSPKFKIDTAKLTVVVNMNGSATRLQSPVNITLLSDYCHNCSYYQVASISGVHQHFNTTFLVDTRWGVNISLSANLVKANRSCREHFWNHYGEKGEYSFEFVVNDVEESGSCKIGQLEIKIQPENSYLPILYAFLILLALSVGYTIGEKIYTRQMTNRTESVEKFINSDLGSLITPENQGETTPLQKPVKERLKSIDSFRGICITIMIFVNYKGGYYWFFHHSAWDGLTVADLVFPWFMFIMGVNIVLSIDSLVRKATSPTQILYKIIRRTLILFFLGLCIINHNTNFTNLRIPGVLQRFAISYLVVTLLQWAFHTPVPDMTSLITSPVDQKSPWWHSICDIVVYWKQWLIILCLEVVWHCLTFLLPVPGCPTGYLGPGGLADQGMYPNCTGGAAMWIDRKVFGDAHIYGHPTAKPIYFPNYTKEQKIPFDPEGLLGSIHSCLIVFLGLQAGKIFLYYKEPRDRIVRWLAWSLFLGVVSGVLTKFSQYDGWIPVNKNLWSTTFVTTLSSMAFFIIPVMYYIIDMKEWWTGVPFYYIGMNSILIYAGHEVFGDYLPFSWGAGATSSHAEMLAMNMLGVTYWVIIAYYCYKIKFFVKI